MNKKVKKELWKLLENFLEAIIIVTLSNLLFLAFKIDWSKPLIFIRDIFISFFISVFVRYACYYWKHLLEDENKKNRTVHLITKKQFNSLAKEFIKDSEDKNIMITFENNLGKKEIIGCTKWGSVKLDHKILGIFKWKESKEDVYLVSFLNNYFNDDRRRETVVHEFTHLYLLVNKYGKDHEHDDDFYSLMDKFEDWLDKKWNLPPRKNKGDDWDQHVDPKRREWRRKQYFKESETEEQYLKNKLVRQSLADIPFYAKEVERWEIELKFWQEKVKTEKFKAASPEFKKRVFTNMTNIAKHIETTKEGLIRSQDNLQLYLSDQKGTNEEQERERED